LEAVIFVWPWDGRGREPKGDANDVAVDAPMVAVAPAKVGANIGSLLEVNAADERIK